MTETLRVKQSGPLRGTVRAPGDKSISHRAALFASMASGTSTIRGFLNAADCRATLQVLRQLGADWELSADDTLTVAGRGIDGLVSPTVPLDCANSGTTMRLLAGLLAGQPFGATLTGSPQLLTRPMARVLEPLRLMDAEIDCLGEHGRPPLELRPGSALHGIDYTLPMASAQVASAIVLAGLRADGPTVLQLPAKVRDHTWRMLRVMGAGISTSTDGLRIEVNPVETLRPLDCTIPGDFSSAAFLLVAAMLVPGSDIRIDDTGVNPSRLGLSDALLEMGVALSFDGGTMSAGEPSATIAARAATPRASNIGGAIIPLAIDELPLLALLATQAEGTTTIRDAAELRVKESDRIASTATMLRAFGANIEEQPDGWIITGPTPLHGAEVDSAGDHRLAMLGVIAGLVASGETLVHSTGVIGDSFPTFVACLRTLGADLC